MRDKLIALYTRRMHSELWEFMLFGIFAGLLISGYIPHVPPAALGVACAAYAGMSLLACINYQHKLLTLQGKF